MQGKDRVTFFFFVPVEVFYSGVFIKLGVQRLDIVPTSGCAFVLEELLRLVFPSLMMCLMNCCVFRDA